MVPSTLASVSAQTKFITSIIRPPRKLLQELTAKNRPSSSTSVNLRRRLERFCFWIFNCFCNQLLEFDVHSLTGCCIYIWLEVKRGEDLVEILQLKSFRRTEKELKAKCWKEVWRVCRWFIIVIIEDRSVAAAFLVILWHRFQFTWQWIFRWAMTERWVGSLSCWCWVLISHHQGYSSLKFTPGPRSC